MKIISLKLKTGKHVKTSVTDIVTDIGKESQLSPSPNIKEN